MSKYEKVRVSMRNYEKGPRTYAKVPLVLLLLLPPPLLLLLPALLLLLLPSPLLHMWLKFTEVHETVRDTRAVVPRFGTQSSIKCPGIALRVGAIGARRPRSLRLRP